MSGSNEARILEDRPPPQRMARVLVGARPARRRNLRIRRVTAVEQPGRCVFDERNEVLGADEAAERTSTLGCHRAAHFAYLPAAAHTNVGRSVRALDTGGVQPFQHVRKQHLVRFPLLEQGSSVACGCRVQHA